MITVIILLLLVVCIWWQGTRTHGYWRARGVRHERPLPVLGTDAARFLQRRSMADTCADTYRAHVGERFVGRYRGAVPELVLRDPDLIRQVLTTDFKHFTARGLTASHRNQEPLLRNLFFADGDLWRMLRQRMTPAFTSGKLKAMFPLIVERAERLKSRLAAAAAVTPPRPLDARELMARYTTDFIGAVGFGLDADSLNLEDSEFRKLGAKILTPTPTRAITALCKSIFPEIFTSWKFLGQELEDDIVSLTREIRKQRGDKPSGRNDFMDFLLEWQARGAVIVESLEQRRADGSPATVQLALDDAMVAAQAFIFFVAGFETSSSATSFTLHQLAYHPLVQRRAHEDVARALAAHGGRLCYEAVQDMTYLDWTLKEGMRMFPSSGFLIRECTHRYTLPGTQVTLDPGVKVTVPVQALHNDPLYFDRPEEFRPERFAPEVVAQRHKFVYLPFGEGPRSCIGARLGHMQSLAGLAAVLAASHVSPVPGAPRHLRPDPCSTVVQAVQGGIPLLFTPRDEEYSGVTHTVEERHCACADITHLGDDVSSRSTA